MFGHEHAVLVLTMYLFSQNQKWVSFRSLPFSVFMKERENVSSFPLRAGDHISGWADYKLAYKIEFPCQDFDEIFTDEAEKIKKRMKSVFM